MRAGPHHPLRISQGQRLIFRDKTRTGRTCIEAVLKALDNGRTPAQAVDALLQLSLLRLEILYTSEDDRRKGGNLRDIERLLQAHTKHRSGDIGRCCVRSLVGPCAPPLVSTFSLQASADQHTMRLSKAPIFE